MNSPTQNVPYLREQRKFPSDDLKQLSEQVDQCYIDIAQKVNARTVGIFSVSSQTVTGERWSVGSQIQQTIRQVYNFSDSALTIPHGLNLSTITNFTRIYGCFFDGTNWNTLPFISTTSAANQISVAVNSTNIVITKGAGAPSVSQGLVVLEFLSQY